MRMLQNWNLSNIFLMIRPELWILRRKIIGVSAISSYLIRDKCCQDDLILLPVLLILITQLRKSLSCFSTQKLLFPPTPFPLYSLLGITQHSLHWRNEKCGLFLSFILCLIDLCSVLLPMSRCLDYCCFV